MFAFSSSKKANVFSVSESSFLRLSSTSSGTPLKSFGISMFTNPNRFSSESRAKRAFFEAAAMMRDLSFPSGMMTARSPTANLSSSRTDGSIFPILSERKDKWSSWSKGTLRLENERASSFASFTRFNSPCRCASFFLSSSTLSRNFCAAARSSSVGFVHDARYSSSMVRLDLLRKTFASSRDASISMSMFGFAFSSEEDLWD